MSEHRSGLLLVTAHACTHHLQSIISFCAPILLWQYTKIAHQRISHAHQACQVCCGILVDVSCTNYDVLLGVASCQVFELLQTGLCNNASYMSWTLICVCPVGQTWGNERDMHHTDQASFVAAINTLYTAMASPMHCHSFLNSQALVDSVLEDAAVPHGPSANYSKVPHYVAVLLQVCQVELQLGSSNFYSLLCKTGLLERSLIAAGAMFMVGFQMWVYALTSSVCS